MTKLGICRAALVSPAAPFTELRADVVHLMLEHLHPFASGGVLGCDDREGLTGLNRPIEAEVAGNLVFDLRCLAVLARDPVQPVAVGLVTIARHQDGPGITKMLLTPLFGHPSPIARRAFTARAERSWPVGDHHMTGDLRPCLDLPRRDTVCYCEGMKVHVLDGIRGHRQGTVE